MRQAATAPLTYEDLLRMKQDRKPNTRAAIARKIVAHMEESPPDSGAYKLAVEIADFLQKDKYLQVRQALAEEVCSSHAAPRELVVRLANDVADEVATPVLRKSPLLEDEDIRKIVQETENLVRLVAVAERKMLSVTISALLVEKNQESVSAALLGNEMSRIEGRTYLRIAELHAVSPVVLQHMVQRVPMPKEAIERMRAALANQDEPVKEKPAFSSFANMPAKDLTGLVSTLTLLGAQPKASECQALCERLEKGEKINAVALLTSLSMGQLTMFYAMLGESAPAEDSNTDASAELGPLLMKAGVSPSLFPLVEWVWSGAMSRLAQGVKPSSRQLARLMSIHIREGARRGVNFASTMGIPIAQALDKLC